VDIRTDFMVYKNEHNLIDALAKAKGISIAQLGPAMYKSSMKKFIKIYILLIIKLGLMLFILSFSSKLTG
jgi:hypothetical protein